MRITACLVAITFSALAFGTTANADSATPQQLYGQRISGQVVDLQTGQPIEGAYVSLVWESTITPTGFTGHSARDICYHAAGTTTDVGGRFGVDEWKKWSTYNVSPSEPYLMIYAPRYEPIHGLVADGTSGELKPHLDLRYALKKFSGGTEQRLEMLFWNLANRSCAYGGASQKSLYPMLKAIYSEARSIAATKSDRQTLRLIAEFAADAGLARQPNQSINEGEIDKFIRENLE